MSATGSKLYTFREGTTSLVKKLRNGGEMGKIRLACLNNWQNTGAVDSRLQVPG